MSEPPAEATAPTDQPRLGPQAGSSLLTRIILIALAINFCVGIFLFWREGQRDRKSQKLFQEAHRLIQSHYVDPEKSQPANLAENAIKGMVVGLDRFSHYREPIESVRLAESISGSFAGIGISFQIIPAQGDTPSTAKIRRVLKGSPAEKAGLRRGEHIVAVDGQPIPSDREKITNLMRGEIDSKVVLTLLSEDGKKRQVELTRTIIQSPSVSGARLLEPGIGYFRLDSFTRPSADEVTVAIDSLAAQGCTKLVIDLRFNPGGLVDAAVGISSLFLPKQAMIVAARDKKSTLWTLSDKTERALPWPIVILMNSESASASELTASCLRDHQRAILVGSKSYGKGSMQQVYGLSNGGSLAITTALYYTLSGYTIHEKGLLPDLEIALSKEDELLLFQHLMSLDDADSRAELAPYTDVQLDAARQILQQWQPSQSSTQTLQSQAALLRQLERPASKDQPVKASAEDAP